jgi:cystathionine beta-lyase/cystathionine gamma-synthase
MPSLATTAVHAGHLPPRPGTPSAPPIVLASGWTYPDMATLDAALGDPQAGFVYSRNAAPTQEAFEAAVTALEGGASGAAFASGMAAIHATLAVALGPQPAGLVAATELYGASQSLIGYMAAQSGLPLAWVDIRDLDAVRAALGPGQVLLYEVISNPLCRVADAAALGALAQAAGARVVVDSTFSTPCLIRPLAHGAQFVVHSATKYLGGHGDVLGGVAVAGTETDALALRRQRQMTGANLSPFDAFLALRGLRTLALRVREQNRNALGLAEWLAAHPRVAQVHYSGLPANADHAVARRLLGGCFGGMLAFDLKDAGQAEVFAFMEKLQLIQRIPTLGDTATLAAYPAHASHRALSPQQREALGITDACVRLSAGIEDLDDLIADLEQALG